MQISKEQYNKLPERLQQHFYTGNFHCTTKPIALMKYLCRLITPKDGTILDCFMGSGSTGVGAKAEGFNFIGIELDEEYCKISQARIGDIEIEKFDGKYMSDVNGHCDEMEEIAKQLEKDDMPNMAKALRIVESKISNKK